MSNQNDFQNVEPNRTEIEQVALLIGLTFTVSIAGA